MKKQSGTYIRFIFIKFLLIFLLPGCETIATVWAGEPVALEYIRKIDLRKARSVTLDDLQEDKTVWPLYLEGLRHMRNKDYRAAIAAWEKVLQTYPNSESTLSNIEQARLRLESESGQQ